MWPINDSDEADVSTYETGATSGKLRIHLNAITKYADCQSEAAVASGLHRNDASTQRRIVTTFPTEVFSDDRTEREVRCLPCPIYIGYLLTREVVCRSIPSRSK